MRAEFVNLLRSQKGYHEGRDPDGTWNNHQKYSAETPGLGWSQDQPYCATFQAWGAHERDMDDVWPMTASCSTAVAWWQRQGRWSWYAVLGGPAYFGPEGGDHTAVVYAYDTDWIYTIEANTNTNGSANGDGVYERRRPRRGPGSPYGYGVPAYPEGTVSADPALGGTRAASVPNTPVQEDDMPLSDDDVRKLFNFPLGDQYAVTDQWGGRFVPTMADALNGGAYSTSKAEAALAKVDALAGQLTAQSAAITALATQLGQAHGVDTATVVEAVQDAIARATVNVHVDVAGPAAAPKGA